jgi:hypothetical protein
MSEKTPDIDTFVASSGRISPRRGVPALLILCLFARPETSLNPKVCCPTPAIGMTLTIKLRDEG